MPFWWQLCFLASCLQTCSSSLTVPEALSLRSTGMKVGKQPEIRRMIEHEIEERLLGLENGTVKSSSRSSSVSEASKDEPSKGAADTEAAKAAATATPIPAVAANSEVVASSAQTAVAHKTFNFWKEKRRKAERKDDQDHEHSDEQQSKQKSNATPQHHNRSPVPNGTDRVLFFWAVGAEDRVMNLVMQNVAHAREQLPSMDVYLAHYDSKQAVWVKKNAAWYHENVDFSSESTGYKFQLMKKLLSGGPFSPDLDRYAWVWALDEDVDFTKTNLKRLFELAETSGALLGLPTFTELDPSGKGKNLNYPMQTPQTGCSYRYSPVVEVIFPFIRPAVLTALFHDCKNCIHPKSVWGLDRIWCSWSARSFQWNPHHACALIDETPVVHKNFKTLRGKYIVSGAREMQAGFMDMAMADFKDVQKHHGKDFVEGAASTMQSSTCVMPMFRHTSHMRFRKH